MQRQALFLGVVSNVKRSIPVKLVYEFSVVQVRTQGVFWFGVQEDFWHSEQGRTGCRQVGYQTLTD